MSRTNDYLVGVIEEQKQTITSLISQLWALKESTFDEGWRAHFDEYELQKKDPSHPITDTNPYRNKENK